MQVLRVKDYDKMSELACSIIVDLLKQKKESVLGLATGSTPEGLYKQLIKEYQLGSISFQQVKTFNLDEYVGLSKEDLHSYHHYMREKFFDQIDLHLEKAFIPNGQAQNLEEECVAYEEKVKREGPVDIQVLGIGVNGHIGFNEPGTPFSSRTHFVDLAESTRQANTRFFNSLDEVPKQAITMGLETILQAKKILLLVSGQKKSPALKQLLEGDITEDFPASILKNHPNTTIIADQAAIG